MDTIHSKSSKRLYETVSRLNSAEEVAAFFEDLCTIKEILDMAQRLDTAILLDEHVNYQEIAGKVSVSTATISRVSKCLNYGSGGYRIALDKLSEEDKKI